MSAPRPPLHGDRPPRGSRKVAKPHFLEKRLAALSCVALALALAGCEKAQTTASGPEKKNDTPSWQAASSVFVAPGWTPGDKASWEAQLRNRAQAQNDYAVPK